MKQNDLFSLLGLSRNEARVYKALLQNGPSSVSAITRFTKLHRPSAYRAVEALVREGLVGSVPTGKRQRFVAMSPSTLRDRLKRELSRVDDEITPLEYLFEKQPQRPTVRFLEGKIAIAHAYLSIPATLKKGDVYYRYSSRDVVNRKDQIDSKVIESYKRERDRKQLERFVITSEANSRLKKSELTRAMKAVPASFDLFDHDVSQVIYGNNILLIDYNSQTAVVIESPTLAHFQKRIFQILFRLLPNERMK